MKQLKVALSCALILICALIIIASCSLQHIVVCGESMVPTYKNEDKIWMKKKFLSESYSRFNIILFNDPYNDEDQMIKRIVGLPGESVYAKDGKIYINNRVLEEPMQILGATDNFGPFKISEDEYFVLGDNRKNSSDSRIFGPIKSDTIKAKSYNN